MKVLRRMQATRVVALFILGAIVATPALAASCQKEGSFGAWLEGVKREAASQGVSQQTINAALAGVRFDQAIVNKDRAQGVFAQTFLEFSDRMVAGYRLTQGKSKIAANKALFSRIEKQYGVPAPVLVSFWGLETDFGANIGNGPTLISIATLAYDCRRPDVFRPQLIDALKIIDRGDLTPAEMRGPWAGELGQVQFLATHYYDYGVDFDGDGKVNMLKSSADALASAANLLKSYGWQAGQPWLQEVRVPADLPWQEADLDHPASALAMGSLGGDARKRQAAHQRQDAGVAAPARWGGMGRRSSPTRISRSICSGTRRSSTRRLPPISRHASPAQAPVSRGKGGDMLNTAGVKEMQALLKKRGYDVGKADGIVGLQTRAAIKAMQVKFGLPADSYPSPELLAKLRGG